MTRTKLTQKVTVMRILMMIGCMIGMIEKDGSQSIYHLKQVLSRGQMHAFRGYLELQKRF